MQEIPEVSIRKGVLKAETHIDHYAHSQVDTSENYQQGVTCNSQANRYMTRYSLPQQKIEGIQGTSIQIVKDGGFSPDVIQRLAARTDVTNLLLQNPNYGGAQKAKDKGRVSHIVADPEKNPLPID